MERARGEEGSKPPSAHQGGVVLLGIASTFSTAWVRKQNRRYMRLFRFGLAWWMHAGERAGGDAGVWVDAARLVTAAAYARTAFCSRQNSAGMGGCLHATMQPQCQQQCAEEQGHARSGGACAGDAHAVQRWRGARQRPHSGGATGSRASGLGSIRGTLLQSRFRPSNEKTLPTRLQYVDPCATWQA